MQKMYERLIEERNQGDAASREQFSQLTQIVQQVANAGLHTQRDVGVAAAGNDPMEMLGQLAGVLQPKQQTPEPVPQPKASKASRFCAVCGTEVDGNAMYCPGCGDPTRVGFR